MKHWWFSILLAWSGLAHAAEPAPANCAAVGGVTPICGFSAPEDIDALPDGSALVVGALGRWGGGEPGGVQVYYPGDGRIDTLFRPDKQAAAKKSAIPLAGEKPALDNVWGDPTCSGPPAAFSAHGLHVSPRGGGTHTLLVVNHAGRESIEWFELRRNQEGRITARWQGCVIVEEPLWVNDVAMLPDGGIVATHMMDRSLAGTMLDRPANDRVKSGYVVTWHRGEGWRKVAGTEGALPNGIQVSRDGRVLYVDMYLENTVAAIDRLTGRTLWRSPLGGAPDNLSIAPDGRLLVSTHPVPLATIHNECLSKSIDLCELPFIVYELNAETGAASELHAGRGAPIGGVTVAVQAGDQIYFGSYSGNRIGRIPAR